MIVRKAMLDDLKKCLKIEGAFKTDKVFKLSKLKDGEKYHIKLDIERLNSDMEIPYEHNQGRLDETIKDGEVLVADDDGKIVGFSEIRLVKWNHSCWVINMIVDSAYRHQGIGSKMMDMIKLSAKEYGMRTLMYDSSLDNYPAFKFYQKNGFKVCGLNDSYYNGDAPALFMCYNLE
jgi:ribosomal protein S18 acetylase RimI-like enzyme